MNIIFLDIDGVLNNNLSTSRTPPPEFIGIDDDKAAILKEIVNKTKAKICLISSWRTWPKDDCHWIYLVEKIGKPEFETDVLGNRAIEIKKFLLSFNGIDNFVIIDDEDKFYQYDNYLKDNLLKVNNGLNREIASKIIQILTSTK